MAKKVAITSGGRRSTGYGGSTEPKYKKTATPLKKAKVATPRTSGTSKTITGNSRKNNKLY